MSIRDVLVPGHRGTPQPRMPRMSPFRSLPSWRSPRRGLVVWQAVFIAPAASRGDDEQQCHWHDTRYEWQGAGATDDRGIEELADEKRVHGRVASVVSSTLPLVRLKSHV